MNYPKTYSFPAILMYDSDGISIIFPDLPGCCPCAKTEEEAFHNAREAMGLHLFGMEQDDEAIPNPTPIHDLQIPKNGIATIVETFMPTIRDEAMNRAVKKTLTIPAWLNAKAEAAHINFSQLLQESIKKYLGIM